MKIVTATLVKSITDDGLVEIHDHVELGKKYEVDLDSISLAEGFNVDKGKYWQRLIVWTLTGEWLPVELLKIEGRD